MIPKPSLSKQLSPGDALKLSAALVCLLLAPVFALSTTPGSQIPSGKDVVSPTAYVSYDPVARGATFQIAVVMKIRPGFHVNAREVSEDYLIRTDLKPEPAAGFKIGEVTYPKGTLQTFSFSKNKALNVYSDSVILRVPVSALPEVPAGSQHLTLKLRYQACSNEICLPPVTLPVDVTVNVASSPSSARPANPQMFPPAVAR